MSDIGRRLPHATVLRASAFHEQGRDSGYLIFRNGLENSPDLSRRRRVISSICVHDGEPNSERPVRMRSNGFSHSGQQKNQGETPGSVAPPHYTMQMHYANDSHLSPTPVPSSRTLRVKTFEIKSTIPAALLLGLQAGQYPEVITEWRRYRTEARILFADGGYSCAKCRLIALSIPLVAKIYLWCCRSHRVAVVFRVLDLPTGGETSNLTNRLRC